jgi:hypothetical protein
MWSSLGEKVVPGTATGVDDLGGTGEDAVREAVVFEMEPQPLDQVELRVLIRPW